MRTVIAATLLLGSVAFAEEPRWVNDEAHRLAEQATVLQKQAQREKSTPKYEQAHALYQQYLAKYPDVNGGQLSFFDAELLYNLQRYDEAAKMYERVLSIAPRGQYAADAAYADVIATKNVVSAGAPDDGGAACPSPAPCALGPGDQRLIDALDRYLTLVPHGSERPAMEYRRARIWYDHNEFNKAAPLFDHIFTTWPEHELAAYAVNQELDCMAVARRFADLRQLLDRVAKSPVMRDETVRQQVQALEAALQKKAREAR